MNEIALTPDEHAEVIIDFTKYDSVSKLVLIGEDNVIFLPFKMLVLQTLKREEFFKLQNGGVNVVLYYNGCFLDISNYNFSMEGKRNEYCHTK